MKLITSVLLCLSLSQLAAAQSTVPDLELRLAPVRQNVRSYRLATISLVVAGAALTLTGGLLWGLHDQSDGKLDTGIAMTGVGGAVLFSSIFVGINTAGRAAGLHQLRTIANAAPADRVGLLDAAEIHVRHDEFVALGLFVSGLALFGAGTAMALVGLGNPLEGGNTSGNAGLLYSGIVLSVSGDALWATGSGLLAYEGGKRSALRQGRSTINLLPTGVAGTF